MNFYLKITSFFSVIFIAGLLSCAKEKSCEGCSDDRKPPLANAGKDTILTLPHDSVLLDGSSSSDPDGFIAGWQWTKISGPSAFSIRNTATASTMVSGLGAGTYSFELKVTDNDGLFSKDTVQVLVDSIFVENHPPIADAGPDQTIILPVNSVQLDGSGSSDPDNNIVSYLWRKISGPAQYQVSNVAAMQTQAGNLVLGAYLFELKVTDAGGLFDTDTVKISVRDTPIQPPVADAGTDLLIPYNLETCTTDPSIVLLNGSASYDPDGIIVFYQWTLIFSDNPPVTINNPNNEIASVSSLLPGTYIFRLVVTDNDGATDDDTLVVNVVYANRQHINAQLIPIGNLSQTRKVGAVAAAGNKIFFAGGRYEPTAPGPNFSSRVDVYDISTSTWSTAELSQPRWGLTAVTSGNKVFFAGGTAIQSSPPVGPTTRVDIYDVSTDTWSIIEMPRAGGPFVSLAHGDNIFIAGGNTIDIYNTVTGLWSSKTLDQPRYLITATNNMGKLHFSGGITNINGGVPVSRIDIYDPTTQGWSVSDLSKPKYGMAGAAVRGKNFWAGGMTANGMTNEVEIFDPLTQSTYFSCLFQPNSFSSYSLGRSNNQLVFFVWDGQVKNKFDIYNTLTDTWYIGVLDQSITPSLVVSLNNTIYVAGGTANGGEYYNQVWKLQF